MRVANRDRLFRFGPFIVDASAHELRRNGVRVPLQEKQFRLLMALLERPGEVHSRTELHQALWPESGFGEFDIGLNQAVRRLRRALGDSASHPTWIETVPRVGYRFIGPLADGPDYRRAVLAALGAATAGLAIVVILLQGDPMEVSAALDVSRFREIPLTSYQGEEIDPTFSPDGHRIAYSHRPPGASSWNIFMEEIDSRRPIQLTNSPEQDLGSAWSPDGRSIAFLRRESRMTGGALMVMPAAGGAATKLLDLDCRDFGGLALGWSPDGARIAFAARTEPTGPLRIGLFDIARGVVRWLTSPELGLVGDTQPAFSPDGSRLAFVRRSGYSSGWNIHVLELGPEFEINRGPRQVTQFENMATSPRWSLDGSRILFLGEQGPGQAGIWSTPLLGRGEPELIWRSEGALLDSRFSSASIAVGEADDGGLMIAFPFGAARDEDVYRVELAGPRRGESSKLISTSFRDLIPRHSPDGSRIVFHSGGPTRDLWLADADGSNLTRITHLESLVIGPPNWSPDSREIVFHSRHAGAANIYIVNANTHELRPVVESRFDDVVPTWSRDGKSIYFLSSRVGDWSVWKTAVLGGAPVKLLDRWAPTLAESLDGESLFFNDSLTGDFLESSVDFPSKPTQLLARANRELLAFVVGPSGLYFLARHEAHLERSARRSAVGGMLALLQLPSRRVKELFPVQGYLSSVAPDESHALTVHGSAPAVDLRLLRAISLRTPKPATSNHRSARRLE